MVKRKSAQEEKEPTLDDVVNDDVNKPMASKTKDSSKLPIVILMERSEKEFEFGWLQRLTLFSDMPTSWTEQLTKKEKKFILVIGAILLGARVDKWLSILSKAFGISETKSRRILGLEIDSLKDVDIPVPDMLASPPIPQFPKTKVVLNVSFPRMPCRILTR
jgi:hypothetical protein